VRKAIGPSLQKCAAPPKTLRPAGPPPAAVVLPELVELEAPRVRMGGNSVVVLKSHTEVKLSARVVHQACFVVLGLDEINAAVAVSASADVPQPDPGEGSIKRAAQERCAPESHLLKKDDKYQEASVCGEEEGRREDRSVCVASLDVFVRRRDPVANLLENASVCVEHLKVGAPRRQSTETDTVGGVGEREGRIKVVVDECSCSMIGPKERRARPQAASPKNEEHGCGQDRASQYKKGCDPTRGFIVLSTSRHLPHMAIRHGNFFLVCIVGDGTRAAAAGWVTRATPQQSTKVYCKW
jgi:hypothetical protein